MGRRSAWRDGSAYVVIGDSPRSCRLRLLALSVAGTTMSVVVVWLNSSEVFAGSGMLPLAGKAPAPRKSGRSGWILRV